MLARFGFLLGFLAVAGCGPPSAPDTTGIVTLDGAGVDGAMIRFFPAGGSGAPAFFALSGKGGAFRLPPAGGGSAGPGIGAYAVTVSKHKTGIAMMKNASDAAPENSLYPAKYADPKRTPFRVTLKPGNNRIDLEMEGGAK